MLAVGGSTERRQSAGKTGSVFLGLTVDIAPKLIVDGLNVERRLRHTEQLPKGNATDWRHTHRKEITKV